MNHGNATDFCNFLQSLKLRNATLLMDNVAFHKTKDIRKFAQETHCGLLFTPPYSPQYNPIELAFSKIKAVYRKGCVTSENMVSNILRAIKSLSSDDLCHYFSHVRSLL